eukprot:GHVN01020035.1.p1 GENE.GHVN01020035.1~~GHVN01020035.1.p1  ORF type:complete len:290 (+),score=9.00 GHVN01020035.1:215-1084(+)
MAQLQKSEFTWDSFQQPAKTASSCSDRFHSTTSISDRRNSMPKMHAEFMTLAEYSSNHGVYQMSSQLETANKSRTSAFAHIQVSNKHNKGPPWPFQLPDSKCLTKIESTENKRALHFSQLSDDKDGKQRHSNGPRSFQEATHASIPTNISGSIFSHRIFNHPVPRSAARIVEAVEINNSPSVRELLKYFVVDCAVCRWNSKTFQAKRLITRFISKSPSTKTRPPETSPPTFSTTLFSLSPPPSLPYVGPLNHLPTSMCEHPSYSTDAPPRNWFPQSGGENRYLHLPGIP